MRTMTALTLGLLIVLVGAGQEKKPVPKARYGVAPDLETYPQATAKQALGSILKALDRKRIDYLMAHLAEPGFVDQKVQALGGRFDDFVREVTDHFNDDPKRTEEFRRFLREGAVDETGTTAKVTHKDVPTRQITLRQIEGRWYMNNDVEIERKKGQ
jgi:hypothetical protein